MAPFSPKKRNFRDLSYLVNEEGLRLKEGLFFRSGHLYGLSKKEHRFFEGLHLENILDLRTAGERDKKPDDEPFYSRGFEVPILRAETLGITHERGLRAYKRPPEMNELYRRIILDEHSSEAMGEALRKLLTVEGARLWHCTAGKDRAGLLTALFLSALGYKEEDIVADYVRSDKINRKRGARYRALILVFLWKKKLAQGVYKAMRADKEYLHSAFDAMVEAAGSIKAYVHQRLKISQDEIDAFKAKYMVKAA